VAENPLVRLTRLAAAVRAANAVAEDAQETRDAALAEFEAAGYPIRELADATGLSSSQVGRILITQAGRKQAPS